MTIFQTIPFLKGMPLFRKIVWLAKSEFYLRGFRVVTRKTTDPPFGIRLIDLRPLTEQEIRWGQEIAREIEERGRLDD